VKDHVADLAGVGKTNCIWGVGADTWREDNFEYLDVNMGVMLKCLKEVEWVGRDWIDVAQDRDRWRAVVITVMNRRVL
jgi:hypothetical protein